MDMATIRVQLIGLIDVFLVVGTKFTRLLFVGERPFEIRGA